MADFVAVLRKTIGALGDNTPEMREKVFEKARATIEAKLAAIEPPPPAAVIDRQRAALEDAIGVVRAEYAEPPVADEDDGLEDVLAALDNPAVTIPVTPMPAPRRSAVEAPAPTEPKMQEPAFAAEVKPSTPIASQRHSDPAIDMLHAPAGERLAGDNAPRRAEKAGRPDSTGGGSRKGLAAALGLALLAAAAGGYFWLAGSDTPPVTVADTPPATNASEEEAATTAEDLTTPPPVETVEEAVAPEPQPSTPAGTNGPEKFTQRLMADGTEVDDGPAGGTPAIGEGSSVASAVQPGTPPAASAQQPATPQAEEPATDTATAPAQPTPAEEQAATAQQAEPEAQQQQPAVAVGQRAIFYEERTSAAQGSAETGSIVWSVVQESPGGDLPPEPAIRAEATIPAKDIQLRMTIRRNGDQTLPASHIVEMIFLTPDGFEGGAISNVSRIAFKETEQAAGNPLIGIPAKIADGFFLIALSDAPAETQTNLNLLQRQSWVDIPIVYQSGRRALLSMEKGVPGEQVFQDALRAWNEASSG